VVGDAHRDGVAGDLLGSPPRKEDERQVVVLLADLTEELEAGHAGHLVVGHDAVVRPPGDALERVACARFGVDREPIVLAFEEGRREVGEVGLVVDVEHPDLLPCLIHARTRSLGFEGVN
jgi:hypothetical protein